MIGIGPIACEVPEERLANLGRADRLGVTEAFLRDKVGVLSVTRKAGDCETSDLCVGAARRLFERSATAAEEIECAVVVTQNPDGHGLPHTSAIVHGKLGLPEHCATFDISLGCSGYVTALSIMRSFMEANGMRRGLLFTADPYSKIVDEEDRDTTLLFGDACTVTMLTDMPAWRIGRFDFGTKGDLRDALAVGASGKLSMNGRTVFNFIATSVPPSIIEVLKSQGLDLGDVDRIILHQGSKYVVDFIARRLGAVEKVAFYAKDYGNTVSSSIPMILSQNLEETDRRIIISGFGVGLCWATTLLERAEKC